jgi:predicted ester cyclase
VGGGGQLLTLTSTESPLSGRNKQVVRALVDAFMAGDLDSHVSGTHEGDLPGLPVSGKRLDLKWLMNLVRISDGKIVEEWEIFDQADFASQLGG